MKSFISYVLLLAQSLTLADTIVTTAETHHFDGGSVTIVETHVIIEESRREGLTDEEIRILERIYRLIQLLDEDVPKVKLPPNIRIRTAEEMWPRIRVPKNYKPRVEGLNPANLNGNPSFVINTHMGNYSDGSSAVSSCQATQVAQRGDVCILATAAHCVDDDSGRTQKLMTIDTADYGRVRAITIMNPNYLAYKEHNQIAQDTAIIVIKGPACLNATNVKTIPIKKDKIYDGEQVAIASRWHPGIYSAEKVDDIGRSVSKVVSTSPYLPGMRQGDSGGALLAKGRNGQFELAGVLSHGEKNVEYCADPNYSTHSSMQWLASQTDSVLNQLAPSDSMVSMR